MPNSRARLFSWSALPLLALTAIVSANGCSGASDDSLATGDSGLGDASIDSVDMSPCGPGTAFCGGRCVDLQLDPSHCGACDKSCSDSQVCAAGQCGDTCVAPLGRCPMGAGGHDVCVSLSTDNANCGTCGKICGPGTVCSHGACAASCAAPLTLCVPGQTVDAGLDAETGGEAGAVDAGDGGAGDAAAVDAGAGDAATPPSAPYCANLQSENTNCGACGNVCGAGEICVEGKCEKGCPAPLTLCEPDGGPLACADMDNDPLHCGSCTNACPAYWKCTGGSCALDVLEGFEGATWPAAPWIAADGSSGATDATCAHDGSSGLLMTAGPVWASQPDVVVGNPGDRLSAWVQFSGGSRVYLGFGKVGASNGWMFTAAQNTNQILFQRGTFTDIAQAPQTFTMSTWYRMEVLFGTGGAVTGTLYAADGVTPVNILSTNISGFTTGNPWLRAFGSGCVDTLSR